MRSDLVQSGWCRDTGKSVTQGRTYLVPGGFSRDNGKSVTPCGSDLVLAGLVVTTIRLVHSVVLTWFLAVFVVTKHTAHCPLPCCQRQQVVPHL